MLFKYVTAFLLFASLPSLVVSLPHHDAAGLMALRASYPSFKVRSLVLSQNGSEDRILEPEETSLEAPLATTDAPSAAVQTELCTNATATTVTETVTVAAVQTGDAGDYGKYLEGSGEGMGENDPSADTAGTVTIATAPPAEPTMDAAALGAQDDNADKDIVSYVQKRAPEDAIEKSFKDFSKFVEDLFH